MPKGIMIVLSNPADPSREAEYNNWYTNVHIPQLMGLDGFVSARRFRVLDDGATHGYAAVYDLETEDLTAMMEIIGKAYADGKIEMTDSIEMDPMPVTHLCEQL